MKVRGAVQLGTTVLCKEYTDEGCSTVSDKGEEVDGIGFQPAGANGVEMRLLTRLLKIDGSRGRFRPVFADVSRV